MMISYGKIRYSLALWMRSTMGKRAQSQGLVSQAHPAGAIPSFSGQNVTQVPLDTQGMEFCLFLFAKRQEMFF